MAQRAFWRQTTSKRPFRHLVAKNFPEALNSWKLIQIVHEQITARSSGSNDKKRLVGRVFPEPPMLQQSEPVFKAAVFKLKVVRIEWRFPGFDHWKESRFRCESHGRGIPLRQRGAEL